MFRPNRVGTPYIYETSDGASSADYVVAELDPAASSTYIVNAVNGTPVLDFGYTNLYIIRSETQNAQRRGGYGQQFTVTRPLAGDAVGLEITGSLHASAMPSDAIIVPYIGKSAAAVAFLASLTMTGQPRTFQPYSLRTPAVTVSPQAHSYKEQIVIRDTSRAFGAYSHGFLILTGATAWTLTNLALNFAVRQLNDQQDVGYRDTLR